MQINPDFKAALEDAKKRKNSNPRRAAGYEFIGSNADFCRMINQVRLNQQADPAEACRKYELGQGVK